MPSLNVILTGAQEQSKTVGRFTAPKDESVGRLANWRETTPSGNGTSTSGGRAAGAGAGGGTTATTRTGVVTILVDLTSSPRPPADAQGTINTT